MLYTPVASPRTFPASSANRFAGHSPATRYSRFLKASVLLLAGCLARETLAAEASPSDSTGWTYADQASWPSTYPDCAPTTWQSPLSFVAPTPFPLAPQTESISSNLYEVEPYVSAGESHNFTLEFAVGSGATVTYAGMTYEFFAFHFHLPAEHTLPSGGDYEIHMKSTYGDATAVFAVVFQDDPNGATSPFLGAMIDSINSGEDAGYLDLSTVFGAFESQAFYSYQGSLTTPPCTGGVQFYVLQAPMTVSTAQHTALAAALAANGMGAANARIPQDWLVQRVAIINEPASAPPAP